MDDKTILAFLSGETTGVDASKVRRHLDQCPGCREAMVRLAGDPEESGPRETETIQGDHDTEVSLPLDVLAEGRPDEDPTEPRAAPPQALIRCEPSDTAIMVQDDDQGPVVVLDRSTTLQPGDMVEHFKVMRVIGRGGMGEVYLARDTQLGRKVALKIIHRKYAASRAIVDRFLFEARATARFNHPNIVAIHAVGDHQGQPYVALEYLEGQTLSDRIADGVLRPREAARIALAVVNALQEAHSHNLLHRDLKPSNVLINRNGRISILDFGLAKVISAPLARTRSGVSPLQSLPSQLDPLETEGQGLQGTPAYMAPEQWMMDPTTAATDIWALGLVLHEMLAGRLPYECPNRDELCELVLSDSPVVIPAGELGLPSALAQVISDCLEKDPQRRPGAGEVERQLERYLSRRRGDQHQRCPFRGLLPFDESHVGIFFGREQEIASLTERMREEATLAVVGPSGSGKSSLIRAGVIPRLGEQGAWTVLQLQPGADPFAALATCLLRQDSRAPQEMKLSGLVDLRAAVGDVESSPGAPTEQEQQNCAAQLRRSPRTLSVVLQRLAEEQQTRVLLHVDQLEELYTLVPDEQERTRFLEAVSTAADDPQDPVRVILAVRDDFLYRLAESGGMHEVLGRVVLLRRPGRRLLEEILVRPLDLTDYRYDDPRLVKQMVDAVQDEQSCLPLLQFTARQLWERRDRDRRLLHAEAYRDMGGVEGALANHADAILESIPGAQQELARRVLLRLVTAQGTRQVLSRDQVLEGLSAGSAEVLDRLIQARLVSTRRVYGKDRSEPDLELVHESLIANWGRLRRWVEESGEELHFLAEVSQAAQLWERRGRRPGEVWQGKALDEALDARERCSAALPRAAVEFIEQGQRRQRWRRRRRRGVMITAFAVLALAAVVFAFKECETRRQKEQAESQRAEARREGASAALARGDVLEARAKLRLSLQTRDSTLARLLWWRLSRVPLVWSQRPGQMIYNVDYSPDGSTVAATRSNKTLFLLDSKSAATRRVMRGFSAYLHAVAFSPDGRYLATGCTDGEVRLWDARSGKPLHVMSGHSTHIWTVRFSPDGRYLSAGSYEPQVHIWEVSSGKTVRVIRGHEKMVVSVAFSPGGRYLATGSGDKTVRLWELSTGRQVRVYSGHSGLVGSLAFSPNGRLIASGSVDRTVRLWDVGSGRQVRALTGHTAKVYAVDFSPDGKLLASGSGDRTVRLWEVSSGRQVRLYAGHEGAVYGVRFSPDGSRLTSGGAGGRVLTWAVAGGASPEQLSEGHTAHISSVAFAPDGRRLASAGQDRTVRLWDVGSGRQVRVLRGHEGPVFSVSFSADGRHLASASTDGTVRLWDAVVGRQVRALRGHAGRVFSVTFSPDSQRLLSGGEDNTARVWSVASGQQLRVLRGHTNKVFGVAFSPDGSRLATASQDRSVRLWQPDGVTVKVLGGHEGPVYGVSFSPDGRSLLSNCYNGRLRLWDVLAGTSRDLGRHPRRIVWPAFHPGGEHVGTVNDKGIPQLLDLRSGGKITLGGHHGFVGALAFSADGKLLATAGDNGAVRLRDAKSGRPLWRAPILLASPPELATSRGWISLGSGGKAAGDTRRGKWRDALVRQGTMASVRQGAAGPADLCLLTRDEQVQAWDLATDRMLFSTLVPGARQVLAMPGGCLVRSKSGRVAHYARSGTSQVLVDHGATAMATHGGQVLVTAGRLVLSMTAAGLQRQAVLEATPGISALARSDRWLVLGYDYGNLEILSRRPGKSRARLMARGTPASPVVRILLTPHDTLVAGFANGLLGIWDLHTGQLLETSHLHGPVVHLLLKGSRLYAATELGSHLSWDLSVLFRDYCELLAQVWRKVPVVWQRGLPVTRPPPADHRCARAVKKKK